VSDLGRRKPLFWAPVVVIKLKLLFYFYARNKNCYELALYKQRNER